MAKTTYDRMSEVSEDERRRLDKELRAKGYGDPVKQSQSRRRNSPIIKSAPVPAGGGAPSKSAASGSTVAKANTQSRRDLHKSSTALKSTKKRGRKKKKKSVVAQMNLLFSLKFLRVIKFMSGSFAPGFMEKFDEDYAEALRIIQIQLEIIEAKTQSLDSLMMRLGCKDEAVMQALIDLMLVYNNDFINSIVEKYYDNPEKNIISWEMEIVVLYSELYAVWPWRDQVCTMVKSMINYAAAYSDIKTAGNSIISAREVDNLFRIIFDMFYIRLHWLFCYCTGVKLDPDDPEVARYISSMLAAAKKQVKKKRKVAKPENEKAEEPVKAKEKKESVPAKESEEDAPDSLDDIDGIADIAAADAADDEAASIEEPENDDLRDDGKGHLVDAGEACYIRYYNAPSGIMEKETSLLDINHRCDRVLHVSYIFKKFIEQFSFIFITNKVKYSDSDMEYKMHSYYNEIAHFESDMDRYFSLAESYHETFDKEIGAKGRNYVSSAGRIDNIDRQRQNTGNNLRRGIAKFLVRVSEIVDVLVKESEKSEGALLNSGALIRFDSKVEKDKIVNNHSIAESFVIINAFTRLFINDINPPGPLSGTISLYEELPMMKDIVKERTDLAREREEKRELKRLEREKAELEKAEAESLERERKEAERQAGEDEKRERAERERYEKERVRIELERIEKEKEEREKARLLEIERERKRMEKLNAIRAASVQEGDSGDEQPVAKGAAENKAVAQKKEPAQQDATAGAQQAQAPVTLNHAELWQKAVREKIVLHDRAVNEYIDLGNSALRDAAVARDRSGKTLLKPSDGRNSANISDFTPYINYQYHDVVRRVMEFEIMITDFIRDVLISKYGDRWQTLIARRNEEIKKKLESENELVSHRGVEYDILEMCNIGQKFNIILNDLLWGDFKAAFGYDKTDKSEKAIFQKRTTQVVNLRNDVMHLKTVDNIRMEIGLGAISEITDSIKKYTHVRRKGQAPSA